MGANLISDKLRNQQHLAIPLTLLDINHIYWVFNILSYH